MKATSIHTTNTSGMRIDQTECFHFVAKVHELTNDISSFHNSKADEHRGFERTPA